MAKVRALQAKGFDKASAVKIVQKQTGYSLKTMRPAETKTVAPGVRRTKIANDLLENDVLFVLNQYPENLTFIFDVMPPQMG